MSLDRKIVHRLRHAVEEEFFGVFLAAVTE